MLTKTVILAVKDANEMNAFVVIPEGKGPFPAVIVFQEAFGVNAHIKDVAGRIANEGYIAIAPELFHRTAPPGFESGYTDFSLVMPHFQAINTDTLINDSRAA